MKSGASTGYFRAGESSRPAIRSCCPGRWFRGRSAAPTLVSHGGDCSRGLRRVPWIETRKDLCHRDIQCSCQSVQHFQTG